MTIVTTSGKGQVVIPKEIRDHLGLQPGQKVAVELVRDHVEIRPLPTDPIEALHGMFKGYSGSMAEELVKERKKDARRDEDRSL